MSNDRTVADVCADLLLDGFRKGAAKASAHVVRHIQKELGQKVEHLAGGFEKIAACECSPKVVVMPNDEGGEDEILVHALRCPARA